MNKKYHLRVEAQESRKVILHHALENRFADLSK